MLQKITNFHAKYQFILLLMIACCLIDTGYAQTTPCPDFVTSRKRVASSFHSTIMIDHEGKVKFWGQNAAIDGSNNQETPGTLLLGTNYSGLPVAVAAGSRGGGGNHHQLYLLTDINLYGWGHSGRTINNTDGTVGITNMSSSLPVGVGGVSNIDFIEASGGGLAIVTKYDEQTQTGGEVWVKNGTSTGGAVSQIYGDGTSTIDQSWHRVLINSSNDVLTGVRRLSFSQRGLMVLTANNQVFVWGQNIYSGATSNSLQTVSKAIPVFLPTAFNATLTATDVKIISKSYDGNAQNAAMFILGSNGKMYAMGEGYHGALGQGNETDYSTWQTVKGADGVGELSNIVQIGSNSSMVYYVDASNTAYYSVGALTSNGELFLWGDNNYSMLGKLGTIGATLGAGGVAFFATPRRPDNFLVNDAKVGYFHMGGHTTIAFLQGSNRFCYVGHKIAGSMGDGAEESNNPSRRAFDCINTPNENLCTPPIPVGCAAPSANDLIASSGNATLVINGIPSVTFWGRGASSAEAGVNMPQPKTLFEYNGIPKGVAAGAVSSASDAQTNQMWILTSEGLYGWGYSAGTITTPSGAVGFSKVALPSGVSIGNVSFIRAARGGVALVTTSGHVYIKAGSEVIGVSDGFGAGASPSTTAWNQVSKLGGGVLDGVTELSYAGTSAMAITSAGVYVWGSKTYTNNAASLSDRNLAELIPLSSIHSDFTGNVKPKNVEIVQSGTNGAAQFILATNGLVYAMGYNRNGVLGISAVASNGTSPAWQPIPNLASVRKLSSNNPLADATYSIGALTLSGTLYTWGSNLNGRIGHGNTTEILVPTKPSGLVDGSIATFEIGAFQTVAFKKAPSPMLYTGVVSGGSKGDGSGNSTLTTFTNGPTIVNCASNVYNISGNVFLDTDSLVNNLVDGSPISAVSGTSLRANLLDENGYVIATTAISSGAYSFLGYPSGNYKVQITTNTNNIFDLSTAGVLPGLWQYTGAQLGISPGTNIAPISNGQYDIAVNSNVTNLNFGVNRNLTISGTIWNDADGNATNNSENVTNANGALFVNLVGQSGIILQSKQVAADGTYSFSTPTDSVYTIALSSSLQSINTPLTGPSLPTTWVNTGVNINGTANILNKSGMVVVQLTNSRINNINFGIERVPVAYSVSTSTAIVNVPGATHTVVTLQGSDAEDMPTQSSLTGKTVTITSLPTNATLTYDGTTVYPSFNITNFNPSLFTIDPIDGNVTTNFGYGYIDNAGRASNIASVTMNFVRVPANLAIVKTDNSSTYTPGIPATYTITVSNPGSYDVVGATVSDVAPNNTSISSWTALALGGASTNAVSGTGNLSETVSMPVGSSIVYTVTLAVPSNFTGSLSNTATVSLPSAYQDDAPGNNSSTDANSQNSIADLSVTKNDNTTTYTPGDTSNYTIVVTNYGPSDATWATFNEIAPPGTLISDWSVTFTGGGATSAMAPVAGVGDIANHSLNLPANATATYLVDLAIPADYTGTITNTATINSAIDVNNVNNEASDINTRKSATNLSVTKTGPSRVNEGAALSYTITVSNTDAISNAINAKVQDAIVANFTATGVTCQGVNCPVLTSTSLADLQAGNLTIPLLPVDAYVEFTITGNAGSSASVITNTANVIPEQGSIDNPADNADDAVTQINASISGTVFNDVNGMSDNVVNGVGTNIQNVLRAHLINTLTDAIITVSVQNDGTYRFPSVIPGNYTVVINASPTSTTPTPPGDWKNTGQFIGNVAGNNATTPGVLPIIVSDQNIQYVNFGMQLPPTATPQQNSGVVNPGGVVDVTVPASLFDVDDAAPGAVTAIVITAIPSEATSITINNVVYNSANPMPTGGVTIPVVNDIPSWTVLVDPKSGELDVDILYKAIDAAGMESAVTTAKMPFTSITVAGTLFSDGNGMSDNTINGTTTGVMGMKALLIENGTILEIADLSSSGAYSFNNKDAGNYSVMITAANGLTVGDMVLQTPILPSSDWVYTGEIVGTSGTEALIDGRLNLGAISISTGNVNFGIQQRPTVAPKLLTAVSNPGALNSHVLPIASFTFGDVDGTIDSIRITTLPTEINTIKIGDDTYMAIGGICPLVSPATCLTWPVGGVIMPANNMPEISIDPLDGNRDVVITFEAKDNAGFWSSSTQTTTVPFKVITVSGNVWDDGNANKSKDASENYVSGNNTAATGVVAGGGNLFATLVDANNKVIQSVQIGADGAYALTNTPPNTSGLKIVLGTSQPSVNATIPTATLHNNWVGTGESTVGNTAVQVETATGTIELTTLAAAIDNQSFGIQQRPFANDNTLNSLANPGVYNTYTIPNNSFGAVDNDGTISSITVTNFPSNANSITLNGVNYVSNPGHCASNSVCTIWSGSVVVPFTNGNPTQPVIVDPIDGNTTVSIPFSSTDNGGATSAIAGKLDLSFFVITVSGNIWDDGNANKSKDASENYVSGINTTATGVVAGGGNLFATLVDPNNRVIQSVQVSASGAYALTNTPPNTTGLKIVLGISQAWIDDVIPTAILHTNWVGTGESTVGNTAVQLEAAAGTIELTTLAAAINDQNFGIQQRPTVANKTIADVSNPGGYNNYTLPTSSFLPNDADGTVTSVTVTTFPTNANSITLDGTTYVSTTGNCAPSATCTVWTGPVTIPVTGNNPTNTVTVDPIDGNTDVTVKYTSTDNAGFTSTNTADLIIQFKVIATAGYVWADGNASLIGKEGYERYVSGNAGTTTTNTVISTGAGLYATLLDAGDKVVQSVAVAADGTYVLTNTPTNNSNLKIVLSINQGTIGGNAPAIALPIEWVNIGEIGTTMAQTTAIGTINLSTLSSDINGQNFAINKLPIADALNVPEQLNPGGTIKVTVPALTGYDAEDGDANGILNGTSLKNKIVINTLPATTTGVLYYNNIPVTVGQVIPAYNPALLTVDPASGAQIMEFTFSQIDSADKQSLTPALVTIPFRALTIAGTVLHDINGLQGTPVYTVDGTGTNPGGLNAVLYSAGGTVLDVQPVNTNGTFSFTNKDGGNYNVLITTNTATIGQPIPSVALPFGWVNTGEFVGALTTPGADAIMDGKLLLGNLTDNVTNAKFGIEQLPFANNNTINNIGNPGAHNNYTVPNQSFLPTDADGFVTGITVNSFPTNTNTITLNGTTYIGLTGTCPGNITCTPWPGSVYVPFDVAGNPVQPVLVDPVDGNTQVAIKYTAMDNAGRSSILSGTLSINFVVMQVAGTVWADGNGTLVKETHEKWVSGNTSTSFGITTTGTNLYATLVDAADKVVQSVQVGLDGTYVLNSVPPNTVGMKIILSANMGVSGAAAPAIALPASWVNIGEVIGAGNTAMQLSTFGQIELTTVTTTINNQNFAINHLPTANALTVASQVNPGGNIKVTVPALTGSDPEDGDLSGTNLKSKIMINTLPGTATGVLYYNDIAVTVGQVIPAYNPALLKVDPATGPQVMTFTFNQIDSAGKMSASPALVTLPFTTVNIGGIVLLDANGLMGSPANTVDGTGTNAGGINAVLYANNTVLAVQPVTNNGLFNFTNRDGGNYSVMITTNTATVGQPIPTVSLPNGWVSTGEFVGGIATPGNDLTVDGKLEIGLVTGNVNNAKFGIERLPTAIAVSTTVPVPVAGTLFTLSGTTGNQPIPTATDPEDGALAAGKTMVIVTLPTNTNLLYNGTPVTAGQVIPNFVPAQLQVQVTSATAGSTSTNFTFNYQDAAAKAGITPANYLIDWGVVLPVKMGDFAATADGNKAKLDWVTYTEANNKGFYIERSQDSRDWKEIGFEATQAHEGNSNEKLAYTAYDNAPKAGINYYRLKQTDVDGKFTYSEVRELTFVFANTKISVYPNPATDRVHLKVTDWTTIKAVLMLDVNGREVYRSKNDEAQSGIDMHGFADGTYLILVEQTNNSIDKFKVVKKQ